ncbi:hypothetical protein VNI00_007359 [Paramarasmius palmivorus]|uniref:Uncharacterized protein n=1 Tax=Paramarasmius palmivorus TaxID=297713 RepID=A0AAW0D2J4_9AGAR
MERISTETSGHWSDVQLGNKARIDEAYASSSLPQQGEGSTNPDVQYDKASHDDLPSRLGLDCRRERKVLPDRVHIHSQYNSYVTINNGDHNRTNNGVGLDRRRRYRNKLGERSRVVQRLRRKRRTRKAPLSARPSLKDLMVIALSVTSLYKSGSFSTILPRKGRSSWVECHSGATSVCRTHAASISMPACALNFTLSGLPSAFQTDP